MHRFSNLQNFYLICIFCFSFSDWFMMCSLFHLSGSFFNISLSFSHFLLWLPGFPLSPLPPQSVRLLREIGFCQVWNFLVLTFYSLPLRIVTSFCTRSIFVLKTWLWSLRVETFIASGPREKTVASKRYVCQFYCILVTFCLKCFLFHSLTLLTNLISFFYDSHCALH